MVSEDIFNTLNGFVTILHEFVHCYQYETCEKSLKVQLSIAQDAQQRGDFMWEIQHPFPYESLTFIQAYKNFLEHLQEKNPAWVYTSRQLLRTALKTQDYEYMVWQEWKEGFARWIENRLQHELNLPLNRGGLKQPYSRVLFYAGGADFIQFLTDLKPALAKDLPTLFHRMLDPTPNQNSIS